MRRSRARSAVATLTFATGSSASTTGSTVELSFRAGLGARGDVVQASLREGGPSSASSRGKAAAIAFFSGLLITLLFVVSAEAGRCPGGDVSAARNMGSSLRRLARCTAIASGDAGVACGVSFSTQLVGKSALGDGGVAASCAFECRMGVTPAASVSTSFGARRFSTAFQMRCRHT